MVVRNERCSFCLESFLRLRLGYFLSSRMKQVIKIEMNYVR